MFDKDRAGYITASELRWVMMVVLRVIVMLVVLRVIVMMVVVMAIIMIMMARMIVVKLSQVVKLS